MPIGDWLNRLFGMDNQKSDLPGSGPGTTEPGKVGTGAPVTSASISSSSSSGAGPTFVTSISSPASASSTLSSLLSKPAGVYGRPKIKFDTIKPGTTYIAPIRGPFAHTFRIDASTKAPPSSMKFIPITQMAGNQFQLITQPQGSQGQGPSKSSNPIKIVEDGAAPSTSHDFLPKGVKGTQQKVVYATSFKYDAATQSASLNNSPICFGASPTSPSIPQSPQEQPQFKAPNPYTKKPRAPRGGGNTRGRAPPNQRWKKPESETQAPKSGARGRRGSKKQNLSARNIQPGIEDEFVDIESVDDQAAAPNDNGSDTESLASLFRQDLPTNLPIGQFQNFQRDIGDSDSDDDMGDAATLKDAGVFTAEEISRIMYSKYAQLKNLYEEQFDDLEDEYKQKRSQYIRTKSKLEKSKIPFTSNPDYLIRDDSKGITEEFIRNEHQKYKSGQKLLQYHKFNGQRAVLHKLAMEKYKEIKDKEKEIEKSSSLDSEDNEEDEISIQDAEVNSYHEFLEAVHETKTVKKHVPPKTVVRCEYAGEQGNEPRCTDPAIPMTKFCQSHILNSGKQLLFKPCGRKLASGSNCDIPVLGIIDKLGCSMHHMPVIRDLSEGKKAKKDREAKIQAIPKVRSSNSVVAPLEKLVVNEAVNVAHIRDLIANNRETKDDTDDSEEFEDELAGLPPGPGYMTIKF